jgi:transcription termination factor Rho
VPRIRSKLPNAGSNAPVPAPEPTPVLTSTEVEYETPKQAAVRSIPVTPAATTPVSTDPRPVLPVEFEGLTIQELRDMAKSSGIVVTPQLKKQDIIKALMSTPPAAEENTNTSITSEGILDIVQEGFGFLRGERMLASPNDVYVSQSQIRRFALRTGDKVVGQVRPPKENERYLSLLRVELINGMDPDTARKRPSADQLTPIFPNQQIKLETEPNILSTRLVDLVAPIGRGQRGLIVSPPKAGKTLLLKTIANGIAVNHPDIHLMVLLIGERPEEVTDMRRSVQGEVISSTFDEPVEDHVKVAEMTLERAKRLVEIGQDVVILMDSITRLARAYNLEIPPSGRTLSGGIDPIALYPPKRFFGAARNIENGGSLTIIATCLVDTGSRMDDVIYEEFKGTGNMELHLDRKLAEKRVFPAIDITRSGTRREELLLGPEVIKQVWTMRRMVTMLGENEGTELVLARMTKTRTNADFLLSLAKPS